MKKIIYIALMLTVLLALPHLAAFAEGEHSTKLQSLDIAGVSLNVPFSTNNPGEAYSCTVPQEMDTLDISAVPVDGEATVRIANNQLIAGETTTVSIIVSHDGLEPTYYIVRATRPADPAASSGTASSQPQGGESSAVAESSTAPVSSSQPAPSSPSSSSSSATAGTSSSPSNSGGSLPLDNTASAIAIIVVLLVTGLTAVLVFSFSKKKQKQDKQ